jgi:GNAT superfamily N-acetyltransferase
MVEVVVLSPADAEAGIEGLADLLLDCIAGGASVGFLYGVTHEDARAFWRDMIAGIGKGATVLFAARDGARLVGTALLHPIGKANQPHRAEVAKLLVFRSARRGGIASRLMDALEAHALGIGRTLLTLDTETGSGAEPFYRRRGYVRVGDIPDYCLANDGGPSGTTFYYKRLA